MTYRRKYEQHNKIRQKRNKICRKVGYKTSADARQALKDFGYARGSKRYYRCPFHDEEMYHLTSMEKCDVT